MANLTSVNVSGLAGLGYTSVYPTLYGNIKTRHTCVLLEADNFPLLIISNRKANIAQCLSALIKVTIAGPNMIQNFTRKVTTFYMDVLPLTWS